MSVLQLASAIEMPSTSYPKWTYFPRSSRPPSWIEGFVSVVGEHREQIDSRQHRLTSDQALAALTPGLADLGFDIETSKARADTIRRPVLFGDEGTEQVAYEIDAYHEAEGVVLEIESGRGHLGNALIRDLIRARYLAVGMLLEYRYKSGKREVRSEDYIWALSEIDAIYASGRLQLPFEGLLLFGY